MTVSRRRFMALSGAVVAAAAIKPVSSVLPSLWSHAKATIPAHNEFAAHLGTSFRVKVDSLNSVRVALAEANVRPPNPKDAAGLSGEAFSLIFKGPRTRSFAQGTYVMNHAALGTFPALIVPIDRGQKSRLYQVVVDRRSLTNQRRTSG